MIVALHSELLEASLPCGIYYDTVEEVYRLWTDAAPEEASHILHEIDDTDPDNLTGDATEIGYGDEFGPVPEREIPVEVRFIPGSFGTYNDTLSTDSDADTEALVGLTGIYTDPYSSGVHVKHDASGLNNGSNWTDAFTSLQDGINAAAEYGVDLVKVARGTYYPSVTNGLPQGRRFMNFRLYNGITVAGGYAGTGSTRDTALYPTYLSGDLSDCHTFHVLYITRDMSLDDTSQLDGFTITGGAASGTQNMESSLMGGGMYVESGNRCLISNCIFDDNAASIGGGVMVNAMESRSLLRLIELNGGVLPDPGSLPPGPGSGHTDTVPKFENCTFSNNTAAWGGGIAVMAATPTAELLEECSFTGNISRLGAGLFLYNTSGILCGGGTAPVEFAAAPDLIFSGNVADTGGGWYGYNSPVSCGRMLFSGNRANVSGGGAALSGTGTALYYSVFMNNSARNGGGLFLSAGEYDIVNTWFIGNIGGSSGGGLYAVTDRVTADRTFFHGNRLVDSALSDKKGGAAVFQYGDVTLYNSAFEANECDTGAVYLRKCAAWLAGCTIYGNTAQENAGAVAIEEALVDLKAVLAVSNTPSTFQIYGLLKLMSGRDLAVDTGEDTSFATAGTVIISTTDLKLKDTVLTCPWLDESYTVKSPDTASPLIGAALTSDLPASNRTDLNGTVRASGNMSIGAIE